MLKSTSISPVQAVFGADETKPDLKATQRLRSGDKSSTAIVVEKRPLMRDLISQCLTRMGGFDVAAVATIEECLEFAGANDAIIVLISVAGSPNTEHNQQIVQRATQGLAGIPIVVLSDVEDLHQVMSVLQLGTRGYISTGMSLDVAIEALWLVRAGGQFVPASCIIGMGHAAGAQPLSPLQNLLSGVFTTRQAAVVKALCQGKANKIIAYELKMKESTVKVHVRNIMKKLKAKNRTEVAYITNQLAVGNSR